MVKGEQHVRVVRVVVVSPRGLRAAAVIGL